MDVKSSGSMRRQAIPDMNKQGTALNPKGRPQTVIATKFVSYTYSLVFILVERSLPCVSLY